MKTSLRWIASMASIALIVSACGSGGGGGDKVKPTNTPATSEATTTPPAAEEVVNVIVAEEKIAPVVPEEYKDSLVEMSVEKLKEFPAELLHGSIDENTQLILALAPYTSVRLEYADGSRQSFMGYTSVPQVIAFNHRNIKVVAVSKLSESSQLTIEDLIARKTTPEEPMRIEDLATESVSVEPMQKEVSVQAPQANSAANTQEVIQELTKEIEKSLDKEEVKLADASNSEPSIDATNSAEAPTKQLVRETVYIDGAPHKKWAWSEIEALSDQELVELRCQDSEAVVKKVVRSIIPDRIHRNRAGLATLKCYARENSRNLYQLIPAELNDMATAIVVKEINSPWIALEIAKKDKKAAIQYIRNMKQDMYNISLDLAAASFATTDKEIVLELVKKVVAYDDLNKEDIISSLSYMMLRLPDDKSTWKNFFKMVEDRDAGKEDSLLTLSKVIEAYSRIPQQSKSNLNRPNELTKSQKQALDSVLSSKECKSLSRNLKMGAIVADTQACD